MFQSETITEMLQFAERLYSAAIKKWVKRDINSGELTNGGQPITGWTATVTAPYTNGKITVQRQYDSEIQCNAAGSMRDAEVGSQVYVAKFGSGDNAANLVVIAYTDFRNL